jgi:hypothetical protein
MSDNRVRVWFSLFVLAVFGVGLAGGVLIGRRLQGEPSFAPFGGAFREARDGRPEAIVEGRRGGPPAPRLVERLTRDLDLTPEQRSRVERVLVESRARIETLQRDARGRFEAEQRGLRDEIRKMLTAVQQETFDRNEREARGRFGRRGPPR